MKNFTMNCVFNADSISTDGTYRGSFNANYDNGNIYYNMNIIDTVTNQDVVAEDFEIFKTEVFARITALTDAGFIVEKPAVTPAPSNEEEDEE